MFAKSIKNFGYGVTMVLTVFLLLFILPNFSFNIGDQKLMWTGLDLSVLGINSSLANFHLGTDLYPQKQVAILAAYPNQDVVNQRVVFSSDAQLINQRLDAAGIKDVRVITQITDGSYSIVLEFPSTYSDASARSIASIVATKGIVEFWSHNLTGEENPATTPINSAFLAQIAPDYKPMIASISVSDLSGVAVESRSNLNLGGQLGSGTVWRLRFRDEAADRVNQTIFLAGNETPALLAVDGEPMFIVQGIAGSNEALGVPILLNDGLELRLMSTFLTVAGTVNGTFQPGDVATRPAVYGPEGKTVVAVSVLAMVLIVALAFVSKFKFRASMAPIWAFGFTLLLGVGLLKLGAATLSVVLILSTMIWVLITKYIVADVYTSENQEEKLKQYRNMSLWVFVVLLVLANSGYLFNVLQEFVLVNAMFAFSVLVCSVFFYKFILLENRD